MYANRYIFVDLLLFLSGMAVFDLPPLVIESFSILYYFVEVYL